MEKLPRLNDHEIKARAAALIREHGASSHNYVVARANEWLEEADLEQTNRWRDVLKEVLLQLGGPEEARH